MSWLLSSGVKHDCLSMYTNCGNVYDKVVYFVFLQVCIPNLPLARQWNTFMQPQIVCIHFNTYQDATALLFPKKYLPEYVGESLFLEIWL